MKSYPHERLMNKLFCNATSIEVQSASTVKGKHTCTERKTVSVKTVLKAGVRLKKVDTFFTYVATALPYDF